MLYLFGGDSVENQRRPPPANKSAKKMDAVSKRVFALSSSSLNKNQQQLKQGFCTKGEFPGVIVSDFVNKIAIRCYGILLFRALLRGLACVSLGTNSRIRAWE